MTSFFMDMIGS